MTIRDITDLIPAENPSDDNNMPHAAISHASQWLSATVVYACKHHCIAQGRKDGRLAGLNQIIPALSFLELSLGLAGLGQVCGHAHELVRKNEMCGVRYW